MFGHFRGNCVLSPDGVTKENNNYDFFFVTDFAKIGVLDASTFWLVAMFLALDL